ncbi:hypothetical protein [Burkholderia seminalis]|uniref:hypothetical protein n=1 Tax=Burkholderia seminalis TaxID=488731 RepID=UPI00264EDC97|nr:hypothetical protein [Burkholderia seminalis]MDN7588388.1 hypothetical protein [Burkholderia seminalis]
MSTIKKALNDLAMTKEADVPIREGYSTIHLEDDGGRTRHGLVDVRHATYVG